MWLQAVIAGVVLAGLAAAPFFLQAYSIGLLVGVASAAVLATAWAMFSGPTRYVSLATAAFYGVGAYVAAAAADSMAWPFVLVLAGAIGAVMALVVGLSTLRLAGIYFVIFSFGLAELVRQLITWYEVNITGTLGRYLFVDLQPRHILWQLLALFAVTIALSAWVHRGRIGLALRVIGDDEAVAAHCGINLARTKLLLFVASGTIITLTGAIMSPLWVYIEPAIVFDPTVSFMTVIMALLGGANRLWGPTLGAVPMFLVFEWLGANFPNHSLILLGLLFIAVVFLLPNGVLAGIDDLRRRRARA
ncbi:MAG: branched-chain amino acid ABC transporter permease [Paracoccus sp. (in: a-proteobacteria)]|nr:branched-chain amino acid ABC transporter permease [Paracoccus sp. (in: a-proteobacteria)]